MPTSKVTPAQLTYRKRGLPPTEECIAEMRLRLAYDHVAGGFIWIKPKYRASAYLTGKAAGGNDGTGYQSLNLLRHSVKVHRLVWLWHHGEWPGGLLDHINGDRSDNRIDNLREATQAENVANRVKRSGALAMGVTQETATKFTARIQLPDGLKVNLGTFSTEDAAAAAYIGASVILNGEFSVFRSRANGTMVGDAGVEPATFRV